jgi:hypothetical protein
MNIVAAILYAVAVAVLLATGLGFRGGLTPDAAAIALAGGALVGLVAWWRGRRDPHKLETPRGWGWVPVILGALFALRAFLWLIWSQGDEVRVLSPNNLGDMSLHLTFIEYFANGVPFWPDSPIFSNGRTSYAVGMDLFNSLLTLAGIDTMRGLVWVGLAGAILTGFALWRWGGPFTLMGFLCIGGLLGFAALARPEGQFFQDYPGWMVFDWAWKSLPLALFVTQRGFLFALPAGLLLLSSWRTRFFRGGDGWRLPFLGELLLYAAMPIFHVHTFLALSFLLGAFYLCHPGARWKLATLVGAALIPATVLMWFTTGMGQSNPLPMWGNMTDIEHPPMRPPSKILGWQPGWMVNEKTNWDAWNALSQGQLEPLAPHGRFLCFWLGNFGLWPFVTGALALTLLRLIARRPIPAWWAWMGVLGFVLVTPLLGQWFWPDLLQGLGCDPTAPRLRRWALYQEDSFSAFLLGGSLDPLTQHVLLAIPVVIFVVMLARARGAPLRPAHRAAIFFILLVAAFSAVTMLQKWSGLGALVLEWFPSDGPVIVKSLPEVWNTLADVASALFGLGVIAGGWLLPQTSARFRGARLAAFSVGTLLAVDGTLVAARRWSSDLPFLPANAAPLLIAAAILIVLLCVIARRWEEPLWPAAFVFPALFLFFLCCNVKFAPWAWDNTKLMIWAVLIVMPFLWELLMIRWSWPTRAAGCLLLFFSGFVVLLGGLDVRHHGYFLASRSTLEDVRAMTRRIPLGESFACAPIYNHPLLLTGRKVVLGFPGHLSSHGIQYRGTEDQLKHLMMGDEGENSWRLAAAKLGVRYLYWSPLEEEYWPNSRQVWRKAVQVVARGRDWELFDLDLPRIPLDTQHGSPISQRE